MGLAQCAFTPLSIWSQIETFKVMSVKFISLALESKDEIKIPAGPEWFWSPPKRLQIQVIVDWKCSQLSVEAWLMILQYWILLMEIGSDCNEYHGHTEWRQALGTCQWTFMLPGLECKRCFSSSGRDLNLFQVKRTGRRSSSLRSNPVQQFACMVQICPMSSLLCKQHNKVYSRSSDQAPASCCT